MKQIIIGIVLGILGASAIYIPFAYSYSQKKYNLGITSGKIVGLTIAARAIEEEFGIFKGKSKYNVLFSVKTTDVISINEDGCKKIKVIP
jgi:hypothetical protein